MRVIKSNGEVEEFKPEKLINSLIRVGASTDEALEIANIIENNIKDLTPTRKIYRLAKELLKRMEHTYAMRYSLKKAMMRLGPSGYPFEKFFAKVMQAYNYKTKTNMIEKGFCINHEIDVLAFKKDTVVSVECKYHSTSTRSSDAKVAMYVLSRFRDLEDALKSKYKKKRFEGWLVTNTRLTVDAKRFAHCYNFKVISWRYPEDNGLEKMIETKKLYPITVLIGIRISLLKKLLDNGIVLVQDFLLTDDEFLLRMGFSTKKIKELKRQAYALTPT